MNAQINEDLKVAMKNQDKFTLSVLRMLKSALQLESISKKHELDDNEVIAVLKKQVKLRKDSITEFAKFAKDDKIADLEKEIAIIDKYLPQEASKEEIEKVIDECFSIFKPTSIKDMGQVMKEVTKKLNNADMALVSKLVKEKLQ